MSWHALNLPALVLYLPSTYLPSSSTYLPSTYLPSSSTYLPSCSTYLSSTYLPSSSSNRGRGCARETRRCWVRLALWLYHSLWHLAQVSLRSRQRSRVQVFRTRPVREEARKKKALAEAEK